MAKLALEPDRPPGESGSHAAGPHPALAKPPGSEPSTHGTQQGCARGKPKPPRTQVKAQGATFTQPLLRKVTELWDSVSLSVTETIGAITPSLHLLPVVGRESGKKMGPARWGTNCESGTWASSQPRARRPTEPQSSSGREV